MPLTTELARLDQAAQEARAEVARLELEERKSRRSVEREMAPALAYIEEEARAGREPDPARVDELSATAVALQPFTTMRPVLTDGEASDWVVVDRRIEAQLVGARTRAEDLDREADEFARANSEALLAERVRAAHAVGSRVAVALRDLNEAIAEQHALSRVVVGLGRRTDAWSPEDVRDLPHPFLVALSETLRVVDRHGELAYAPLPEWLLVEATA
jgi:hypothetical protein